MNVYGTQQTDATIDARYAQDRILRGLEGTETRDARLNAQGAAYRAERRLKNINRYLRERAARKEA